MFIGAGGRVAPVEIRARGEPVPDGVTVPAAVTSKGKGKPSPISIIYYFLYICLRPL